MYKHICKTQTTVCRRGGDIQDQQWKAKPIPPAQSYLSPASKRSHLLSTARSRPLNASLLSERLSNRLYESAFCVVTGQCVNWKWAFNYSVIIHRGAADGFSLYSNDHVMLNTVLSKDDLSRPQASYSHTEQMNVPTTASFEEQSDLSKGSFLCTSVQTL